MFAKKITLERNHWDMLQCKVFSVHSLITSCDAAFVFSLMKWEHRYFVLYTAVCKGSVVGHSKLSYKNHWDLKVIYETLIKPASLFSWKTISLGFCNLVFLISLWSHCNRSARAIEEKKKKYSSSHLLSVTCSVVSKGASQDWNLIVLGSVKTWNEITFLSVTWIEDYTWVHFGAVGRTEEIKWDECQETGTVREQITSRYNAYVAKQKRMKKVQGETDQVVLGLHSKG